MADKRADDDDDDDLESDEAAADIDDDGAPAGDDDYEDIDFDDEDDEEGGGGGRGRLIAIVAVAATVLVGAAAGGYFFFVAGDDGPQTAETAPAAAEPPPADGSVMIIRRADPAATNEDGTPRMLSGAELAKRNQETGGSSSPAATPSALTPPPPAMAATETPSAAATSEAPAMTAAPASAPAPGKAPKGATPAALSRPVVETAGLVTPAATAAAYRDIPVLPAGKPLAGPSASLSEKSDFGTLPRAAGAQVAWKAYGLKFDGAPDKPRIAIIITGLGLSRAGTLAAVSQMPPGVTLAFDPYTRNLDEWLGLGRSNGHEALLHLPMEPSDFPTSDPGPMALLTDFDAAQNIRRLHQVLGTAIGYVGVIQVMGSKFAASDAALRPALEELKTRGLMFVNVPSGSEDLGFAVSQEIGLPVVRVDLKLDTELTAAAIDSQINQLEKIAREQKRAVGIAEATPVTLARLSIWAKSLALKNDLVLAPASALAVQSAAPQAGTKAAAKAAPKAAAER